MSYGSPHRLLNADQVRRLRADYRRWQTLVEVRRQLLKQAATLQAEITACSPRRLAEQYGVSRDAVADAAAMRHYKEIR